MRRKPLIPSTRMRTSTPSWAFWYSTDRISRVLSPSRMSKVDSIMDSSARLSRRSRSVQAERLVSRICARSGVSRSVSSSSTGADTRSPDGSAGVRQKGAAAPITR